MLVKMEYNDAEAEMSFREKIPGLHNSRVLNDIKNLAKDGKYTRKMIRDYLNNKWKLHILSETCIKYIINK